MITSEFKMTSSKNLTFYALNITKIYVYNFTDSWWSLILAVWCDSTNNSIGIIRVEVIIAKTGNQVL
jgi:hypothetical protein